MFQNNPLLSQLKQQFHQQRSRVEGSIKANEKGFGFLETDSKNSYFIPPKQMKKVMHGDYVTAVIQHNDGKEYAEPEQLIHASLTRFVGSISIKNKIFFVIPYRSTVKEAINCQIDDTLMLSLNNGDWVVAELIAHPLKDNNKPFLARITEFITHQEDHFAHWLITLAYNKLAKSAPEIAHDNAFIIQDESRQDLSHLPFFTVDNATTKDLDDAIYIEQTDNGDFILMTAIADPTAYIKEQDEIDNIARQRGFTNYLPGYTIPMLPVQLSDQLCSLLPNQKRPAVVCKMLISSTGELLPDVEFSLAWVTSVAQLIYDDVSDYLEQGGNWQPPTDELRQQIERLKRAIALRIERRNQDSAPFKDKIDYQFFLDDAGNVQEIKAISRRIANTLVEEAMIAANLSAARFLVEKAGVGLFNIHLGFDKKNIEQVITLLNEQKIDQFTAEQLLTLNGFCQLQKQLREHSLDYLDIRLRRFLHYAEISTEPQPHFGLNVPTYLTWTSPIRKYSDLVNHRIIKQIIQHQPPILPDKTLVNQLMELRKTYRNCEREITDYLYVNYLRDKIGSTFTAEITDINRGGMRAKLHENGATVFIPLSMIHSDKDELENLPQLGIMKINNKICYKLGDVISVELKSIPKESRNLIGAVI